MVIFNSYVKLPEGTFGISGPTVHRWIHPGVNASREIDCPPNSFNLDGDAANGCEVDRLGDPQSSPCHP